MLTRRSARLAKRIKVEYDEPVLKHEETESIPECDKENLIKKEDGGKVAAIKELKLAKVQYESGTKLDKPNPHVAFPDVSNYPVEPNAPQNWVDILTRVRSSRLRVLAAVDTMGCERLPVKTESPETFRYQLLVALMLSAQTKDEVNAFVMNRLRTELPKGLTVESIRETDEATLDTLIFKVGFHSRKAKYIKQTTEILHEKYGGDVPPTIEEMIALPGVGPKMAHLLMHRAWNRADGIGVDVHVNRLARLWKWTNPNRKTKGASSGPEQTRVQMEEWLPKELWVEINPLLVGFGQSICVPRFPRCEDCDLSRTGLCPGDKYKYKRSPR
ncbi:endonuclease III homolog 2 [Trichomonascus vanleenenianus]|uniref:endonuclease III domain-containing protein n=1 Tax=Trichomonascus vanleenenianus TaxID=2268995 RepID=UPI003EC9ABE4